MATNVPIAGPDLNTIPDPPLADNLHTPAPDHLADNEKPTEDKILLHKIVSLNVTGLGETQKRGKIMNYIETLQPDICVLIDTKLQDDFATRKLLCRTSAYKIEI